MAWASAPSVYLSSGSRQTIAGAAANQGFVIVYLSSGSRQTIASGVEGWPRPQSVYQQRFPANHSLDAVELLISSSVSQQRFPANHSPNPNQVIRSWRVYLSSGSRQTIAFSV